jgi:hypothetical protein
MVARARRDADVSDVVPPCDVDDQGLRAIAPGHADNVGAIRDRPPGEHAQIVAGMQHDAADPAAARLALQVEAIDLASARARVHQENTVAGRADPDPARRRLGNFGPKRDPCGRRRAHEQDD